MNTQVSGTVIILDFFDVYTTMEPLYLHIQYTRMHTHTHTHTHTHAHTHTQCTWVHTHTCTHYMYYIHKLATRMYTISYCLYVHMYICTYSTLLCEALLQACKHLWIFRIYTVFVCTLLHNVVFNLSTNKLHNDLSCKQLSFWSVIM